LKIKISDQLISTNLKKYIEIFKLSLVNLTFIDTGKNHILLKNQIQMLL